MSKDKKSIREKAFDEYHQLRSDDKDFAEQWSDTKKDFEEWFEDVYLPSLEKDKKKSLCCNAEVLKGGQCSNCGASCISGGGK